MANALPKARSQNNMSINIIDYRYINYDLSRKADLDA